MKTPRLCLALAALAGFHAGCKREEIRVYTVAKEARPASQQIAQAMLAAILPQGDKVWFFKLSGAADAVASERGRFEEYLASLHFHDDRPDWTLPAGWTAQPASGMRFATISANGMELTVTFLPGASGAVLPNVNRWRGQLGLPPIGDAELPTVATELPLKAGSATLVHLSAAPAGGLPASHPPIPPPAPAPPKISYATPEGWSELKASGMRLAAFEIKEGEAAAEVTVIALGPEAGQILPNVNRWREQIGLPPVADEELRKDLRELTVGGESGHYIDLAGAERRILAVLAPKDGRVWFYKMTGEPALVGRHQRRFEEFVGSIRYGN